MNLVDVFLLLACLSFAWSGYRQGFLVGLLSLVGFLLGGVAGMRVAPALIGDWTAGVGKVLAAIAIVLGLATLGQALLSYVGAAGRDRVRWRPLRFLDSFAGALASAASVLVIAWFLATALRQSPLTPLSRAVAASRVLTAVDRAMPPRADTLAGSFRGLLAEGNLPQVFGGLTREPIVAVAPPDGSGLATEGIAAAARSVVLVEGRACGQGIEGSGFVFAPRRVMTNAHVVAGVDRPDVRVGGVGRRLPARVVVFDPERDLAVLDVAGLSAPSLRFDASARRSTGAVVAGFPRGGPYHLEAARVREVLQARGPDIYRDRLVNRSVLSLYARVEPGNSGGPLLAPDGDVYGVVFAKSLDDDATGYALSMAEVAPVAREGRAASDPVSTQSCAT